MTHGGIRDTMNPSKDLEVHTMKRGSFAAGFLTCLLVVGVTTTAYAAGIMAERSHHRLQRQNPINRNRIQNPQPLPMMPMWMQ